MLPETVGLKFLEEHLMLRKTLIPAMTSIRGTHIRRNSDFLWQAIDGAEGSISRSAGEFCTPIMSMRIVIAKEATNLQFEYFD